MSSLHPLDFAHPAETCPLIIDDDELEEQTVKCTPASKSNPSRFDPVVILESNAAEAAGLQGVLVFSQDQLLLISGFL